MSYSVILTPHFKREAKRLLKKYVSLRKELSELNTLLTTNPAYGTSLGRGVYKIRLAVKSKGKGKRGGTRIISYVITDDQEVYLLSIYDKSELDTIDENTLTRLIDEISQTNQ